MSTARISVCPVSRRRRTRWPPMKPPAPAIVIRLSLMANQASSQGEGPKTPTEVQARGRFRALRDRRAEADPSDTSRPGCLIGGPLQFELCSGACLSGRVLQVYNPGVEREQPLVAGAIREARSRRDDPSSTGLAPRSAFILAGTSRRPAPGVVSCAASSASAPRPPALCAPRTRPSEACSETRRLQGRPQGPSS